MAYEWGQDITLKLITEMKNRKYLWDSPYNNKTRHIKKEALQEIGIMLNVDAIEVGKRIHNLRTQFNREYAKVQKSILSGASPEEIYEPKWYGYKHLMFLQDVQSPVSSSSWVSVSALNGDDNSTSNMANVRFLEVTLDHLEKYSDNKRQQPEQSGLNIVSAGNGINNEEGANHKAETYVYPESSATSQTNRTSKKRLVKELELNTVFATLKKVARSVYSKYEQDEFSVFGDYVASELRKLNDRHVVAVTKNKITQALFEADLQKMRGNAPNFSGSS